MVFPILGGNSAVAGGYSIDNSVRFNDGDSPDLSRTNVASPTNSKKYTYSVWIKRGIFSDGNNRQILTAINGNNRTQILFRSGSNEAIRVLSTDDAFSTFKYLITTNALYRDASAWYHIICVFDSTNATANDRFKIYVNGVEQSLSISTSVASNYDDPINSGSVAQDLGSANGSEFFDGYFAEAHFIDGQALSPTDFGEFDTDSGIWKPTEYTGSYGTNGFKLDFSDSGSLGADSSPNSNSFTPSNLSATDQTTDTPTNNWCTLNPLDTPSGSTFSEGNLKIDTSVGQEAFTRSTFGIATGKWYFETKITTSNQREAVGIFKTDASLTDGTARISYYSRFGYILKGNDLITTGATFGNGDIIGTAFDLDSSTVTFYKNGTSQGTVTSIDSTTWSPMFQDASSAFACGAIYNFGNPPTGFTIASGNTDDNGYGNFEYAPPTGYLALCTQNLATALSPTIDDGSQYFNSILYTGTGVNPTSRTGVGFQPDWIWAKERSSTSSHRLIDSSRGNDKVLESNVTDAEVTRGDIQSFDSDGFTTDDGGAINESGQTYVAWNWKANGGTTSSNTDGSITSTVQANTTAGFSIVTYTGTGSSSATVGHGLGKAPSTVIIKSRDATYGWIVWHQNLTTNYNLRLDQTDAEYNPSSKVHGGIGTPSSTVLNWVNGTSGVNNVNRSGDTYVAYCFAEIEGYSKFGSYTGNGSTDGTFVYTGFRPAWVMIKVTDTAEDWWILDTTRDTFNSARRMLYADGSSSEINVSEEIDFLSNGFKLRRSTTGRNGSGNSYIYMCFSANPFVSSTGIPVTAR